MFGSRLATWPHAVLSLTLASCVASAGEPRIECDVDMLSRARNRIEQQQEPFYTYWKLAQPDLTKARQLTGKPYLGEDSLAFHNAAQEQGMAARLLAYAWHLEGRDEDGRRAIELLDTWASTNPQPGTKFDPTIRHPNSGMDVARSMLPLVATYDLLGKHPALTNARKQRIERWFRCLARVVQEGVSRWENNDDFGNQEFQNHHAAHVLGLVIFGAALRDEALIRWAVDSPDNPKDFQEVLAGLILMPGDKPHGGLRGKPLHAGEIQDRYRTNSGDGLTYCHLSLTLMMYTADVLSRVTDVDYVHWRADGGESLQLSAEFYSDFFRTRNARIKGDYYFRDAATLRNPEPFLGVFEVARHHWPNNERLQAIVRSTSRARTPRSWLCYYGLPLLTHGVE